MVHDEYFSALAGRSQVIPRALIIMTVWYSFSPSQGRRDCHLLGLTPTYIHYACMVIKWSDNAKLVAGLMRPHCPGCERGLIILLSSSNKAVGEINGYGKLRWKRTEGERMCVGELRRQESRVRDQPLGEGGKEEGGEGGREEEVEISWKDGCPHWP